LISATHAASAGESASPPSAAAANAAAAVARRAIDAMEFSRDITADRLGGAS
jgi:hypothetical protein